MSTFYRVSSLAAEGEQRGRDAVVLCANSLESQQQPLSLSWATQQSRFVKGQLYILMLLKKPTTTTTTTTTTEKTFGSFGYKRRRRSFSSPSKRKKRRVLLKQQLMC
jgi:hypothetical protein